MNKKITEKIFKEMALTSFGLASYNTYNNIVNTGKMREDLENEIMINTDLQNKYDALADKKIENLESINQQNKSMINDIQELINSKSGTGTSSSNYISNSNYFESIQQFINSLNFEQTLSIMHISGSIFILLCLYSILGIFFGNKIIDYFNLEEKYPKIAKFIKIRRQFQNYYIFINLVLILFVLLLIIYINVLILLY